VTHDRASKAERSHGWTHGRASYRAATLSPVGTHGRPCIGARPCVDRVFSARARLCAFFPSLCHTLSPLSLSRCRAPLPLSRFPSSAPSTSVRRRPLLPLSLAGKSLSLSLAFASSFSSPFPVASVLRPPAVPGRLAGAHFPSDRRLHRRPAPCHRRPPPAPFYLLPLTHTHTLTPKTLEFGGFEI